MSGKGRGKQKQESLLVELAQLVIDLARVVDDFLRLLRRLRGENNNK